MHSGHCCRMAGPLIFCSISQVSNCCPGCPRCICENCCTPQAPNMVGPPGVITCCAFRRSPLSLLPPPCHGIILHCPQVIYRVSACAHKISLCGVHAQPAPRSVNPRREVLKWIKGKLQSEDLTDDFIWADNNPARPVLFEPANHKKYNAQVP